MSNTRWGDKISLKLSNRKENAGKHRGLQCWLRAGEKSGVRSKKAPTRCLLKNEKYQRTKNLVCAEDKE